MQSCTPLVTELMQRLYHLVRLLHFEPFCRHSSNARPNEPNTNGHGGQPSADASLNVQSTVVANSFDSRKRRVAKSERDDTTASADHDEKTCCPLREALHCICDTNEVHTVECKVDGVVGDNDCGPVPLGGSLGGLPVDDCRYHADDRRKNEADQAVLGLENPIIPHAQALDDPITSIASKWQEDQEAYNLASLHVAERVEGEAIRGRHQHSGKSAGCEHVHAEPSTVDNEQPGDGGDAQALQDVDVVRQDEVPSGLEVDELKIPSPASGAIALRFQHSAVASGDLDQFVHIASSLQLSLVIEVKVHLTGTGIRRSFKFRLAYEDEGQSQDDGAEDGEEAVPPTPTPCRGHVCAGDEEDAVRHVLDEDEPGKLAASLVEEVNLLHNQWC